MGDFLESERTYSNYSHFICCRRDLEYWSWCKGLTREMTMAEMKNLFLSKKVMNSVEIAMGCSYQSADHVEMYDYSHWKRGPVSCNWSLNIYLQKGIQIYSVISTTHLWQITSTGIVTVCTWFLSIWRITIATKALVPIFDTKVCIPVAEASAQLCRHPLIGIFRSLDNTCCFVQITTQCVVTSDRRGGYGQFVDVNMPYGAAKLSGITCTSAIAIGVWCLWVAWG